MTSSLPNPSTHKDFIAVDYHGKGVSHLDALSHVAYRGQLYDGRAAQEVRRRRRGARFGAVSALGPLVTRGVLLDLPTVLGVRLAGARTGGARRRTSSPRSRPWR